MNVTESMIWMMKEYHICKHPEGQWYVRNAGEKVWKEAPFNPDYSDVVLTFKRGRYFVYYESLFNLEWSWRF